MSPVRDNWPSGTAGWATVVSSDHYATLGVSPSAESATIRAAYRRLMRHYHPDANPDPEAHKRAQAITAAYSVLRDRAKRARYDEERRDSDIWRWIGLPPRSVRPPAGRTAGLAATAFAVLMVSAVLAFLPRRQVIPPPTAAEVPIRSPKPSPVPSRPPVELEPESERLTDLSDTRFGSPPTTPPPKPVDEVRAEPIPAPAKSAPSAVSAQAPAKPSKVQVAEASRVSAPPKVATKALPASAAPVVAPKVAETPKQPGPASPPADSERVAALQRISSGFYDQSLQNADTAKKNLLLSVRVRETYQRAACRSDTCVADSYLRQIRDVGAIMQNRALPPR